MLVQSTLRSAPGDFLDPKPDVPTHIKIETAFNEWKASKGTILINKVAFENGVHESTLRRRIGGLVSRKQAYEAMQKLTPAEERSLKEWILRLDEGGFPVRPCQITQMATEILVLRGYTEGLGKNWL
jgi:hypothetical protein